MGKAGTTNLIEVVGDQNTDIAVEAALLEKIRRYVWDNVTVDDQAWTRMRSLVPRDEVSIYLLYRLRRERTKTIDALARTCNLSAKQSSLSRKETYIYIYREREREPTSSRFLKIHIPCLCSCMPAGQKYARPHW